MGRLLRAQAVPILAVVSVGMLVVPLPPTFLDLLFLLSLSGSIAVAVVAFTAMEPLEFSTFPTMLLLTTLLRVSLDVSAARLILLTANAGSLVSAFGSFVVGSSPVVGILLFVLLFIVQYMVITKGAERVAEVTARFTLDAMAGKQMAIDADLHAGAINDAEARRRRERIAHEAEFYGAMDGASKFVRGDAIATLLVLLVNALAGLVVGVLIDHMAFGLAISTYTSLAIGDALLSQLPAFLLSTAAGILVTRSGSQIGSFSEALLGQIAARSEPFYIVSVFLIALGILMPVTPLVFLLGGLSGYLGYAISRRPKPAAPAAVGIPSALVPMKSADALPDKMRVTVGYALVNLAKASDGGDLLERLDAVAKSMSETLGFHVDRARLRDDLTLEPTEYRIHIRDLDLAGGHVYPGRHLLVARELPIVKGGLQTMDPVYGVPASWVPEDQRGHLVAEGYALTTPAAVIAAHVRDVLQKNAYLLFDRQEAQALLNRVKSVDKAAVEELVPNALPSHVVMAVFHNLLREGIPIRDGVTIVEAMADAAGQHLVDPTQVTERVRQALAPIIRKRAFGHETPTLVKLPPSLEQEAEDALRMAPGAVRMAIKPEALEHIVLMLRRWRVQKKALALMTTERLRPLLAQALAPFVPDVPVLSHRELDPHAPYVVRALDAVEEGA